MVVNLPTYERICYLSRILGPFRVWFSEKDDMGVGDDVEAACFFVEPGWENVLAADDDGEEQTVWVSKKRR